MYDLCSQELIVTLLYNLGVALQADDQLQQAADVYRLAISVDATHSEARNNLSACLNALGNLDEAIAVLREAIELDPHNHAARSNLGHSLLAAGNFTEGWRYCEDRWAAYQIANGPVAIKPADLPIPRWLGEAFKGKKRLLVLSEQGLGDMLQFCRYLPMTLARFSHVSFVCPRPLRRLLNDSLSADNPNLELLDETPTNLQHWDYYAPMLSLPLAFNTQRDTIPATVPYLHAHPQLAHQWATRMRAQHSNGRPCIGLVWAGGHSGTVLDRRRSLDAAAIAPLLNWPHAQWLSLQKPESAQKQLPHARFPQVIDWMDEVDDFADTAALIAGLDLVISVDTSVAHLAAAMGKRVWLLNRYAGCWRWLRNREDSPWYPGMRIFTQRTRGDWTDVLARVLEALQREYFHPPSQPSTSRAKS
nr:tetratricopeptide repeat protein [Paraburkholderia sp. Ac-20340]